ncbi:MAG: hypothetical protein HY881_05985 [Deltaproteobacteria bacterium]|nr:hypothetical protein [Deltaproteobacteria bacterium]
MKNFKLWGGLFALFCSGVLLGMQVSWRIAEDRAIENLTREHPRVPKSIIRKLDRELELTDTQRKRIEEIVCRTHRELLAFRDRIKPDRERIIQQSIDAMKAELFPEQQKKLDALRERRIKASQAQDKISHKGRSGDKDPCE